MAHRVNLWLAVPALVCVALAVVYVPPRHGSRPARVRMLWAPRAAATPEGANAERLARAWQHAEIELRFAAWRARLAPELQRRRAADQPTLAIAFEGSFPDSGQQWLETELHEAWRSLGLATTKIGVGVVLSLEERRPSGDLPRRIVPWSPAYQLPDSSDRETCVAIAVPQRHVATLLKRPRPGDRVVALWLRRVLGPCAFLAAFGKPSPPVERWLSARRYDFAADAVWDGRLGARPESWWKLDMGSENRAWMWRWLYQLSPSVTGCAGGRPAACGTYALRGADSPAPPQSVIATSLEWHSPPLPGASELLSQALHEFGRARFARFWTSDLPVDSAFHVAMDTTLGDWVLSRQRAYGVTLDVGPAPPFGASLIGLGLAALGLVLAIVAANRRAVG